MDKKITFKFTAAEIDAASEQVYKQSAAKYKVEGFREGKAPRKMIESQYGEVFFESALNKLFSDAYNKYLDENPTIRPVSDPEVDAKEGNGGIEFVATITCQDEFTLGKYKGLEIKKHEIKITDKEVDAFLTKLAGERAREVASEKSHKIEKGNIAVIDFEGFTDGKAFDGGKASNHELEIGSKSFIDTFEDQLIGKSIGDKIDVNVTFPKEYHAENLAGKPALFKVTINNILIKQIPAIDDALAKESSEFNTLAEFKADIKKRLEKQAQIEADHINEEAILAEVVKQTKVEPHPKLVDRQFYGMMQELQYKLSQSGISLDMYAAYNGMSLEDFQKRQREFAQMGAKTGLVLEAIGQKEGLKGFEEMIKFVKENNKLC